MATKTKAGVKRRYAGIAPKFFLFRKQNKQLFFPRLYNTTPPLPISPFFNFQLEETSITRVFILIYKAIILITVNIPMVSIYKFCKQEIVHNPTTIPGEHQKHHLGELSSGKKSQRKNIVFGELLQFKLFAIISTMCHK